MKTLETTFGGFTRGSAEVEGAWKDPDTGLSVRDRSRVFEVDVEETELDAVRSLLRRACVTFVQKCIRTVILGRAEYIERGPDDEPL